MNTRQILAPAVLAGITLRNRFVRSATFEGMAESSGKVTSELVEAMRKLAAGRVGLIISGHAYVSPVGKAGDHQLAIDGDDCIEGLAAMASAVHGEGGKLVIQLAHAGGMAASEDPQGPSPFVAARTGRTCRGMTIAEIDAAVAAFVAAAERARLAGCDGVQIHAAHGYLLSQFLSPLFNQREDEYGGSVTNRARLLLQILDGIKARVGREFPVLIKINSQDFSAGGFSEEDMLAVARLLEKHGIDAIELSGGLLTSTDNLGPSRKGKPTPENEAYFRFSAARLKPNVKIPVILVGGIRSADTAEQMLREHYADFISLSRPFIREPGLIGRWSDGDQSPATCISCNLCFRPVLLRTKVYCLAAERAARCKTATAD